MEIVNWGWDFAAFAPYSDVQNAVGSGRFGLGAARRQLADTVPRQFHLGFLYEQLPDPDNRVYVTDNYLDRSGSRGPASPYDVDDYTRAGMTACASALDTAVRSRSAPTDHTDFWPTDPGYLTTTDSPTPTTAPATTWARTGWVKTAEDSVVDTYQRCWEHENMYLVGCGSLPTIATSNPFADHGRTCPAHLDSVRDDLGRR